MHHISNLGLYVRISVDWIPSPYNT
jgi:hypothetical protein